MLFNEKTTYTSRSTGPNVLEAQAQAHLSSCESIMTDRPRLRAWR